MAKPIDADLARSLYDYDSTSGDLTFRAGRGGVKSGSVAGAIASQTGYRMVWVGRRLCTAHRVIWAIVHGDIPYGMQIDHIDGDRLNNKLSNLRLATHLQNNLNRCVRADSKSGFKGVQLHRETGKWRARITLNGRQKSLGLYHTPEQAGIAYANAARDLHGEFARVA